MHLQQFKGMQSASKTTRYLKGVLFADKRDTKGVPFLSKMVYKRVRGWTSGQSLPV